VGSAAIARPLVALDEPAVGGAGVSSQLNAPRRSSLGDYLGHLDVGLVTGDHVRAASYEVELLGRERAPAGTRRSNTAGAWTTRWASALLRIASSSTSDVGRDTISLAQQARSLHRQLDVGEAGPRLAADADAPHEQPPLGLDQPISESRGWPSEFSGEQGAVELDRRSGVAHRGEQLDQVHIDVLADELRSTLGHGEARFGRCFAFLSARFSSSDFGDFFDAC
jgi:hypothetical protein